MPRLIDVASVIRSKNAGPLTLSLDLIFPTEAAFSLALASPALTPARLGPLFAVCPDDVRVTAYVAARAIKLALPRSVVAGSPGDRDVYGAQQHAPLLQIDL